MAKRYIALLLATALIISASGCASPFKSEYHYSEPYTGDEGELSQGYTEVNSYNVLKTTIMGLISSVKSGGELRVSNYDGNISDDLSAVCFEIKSETPIGAFAVDTLSYEISQIVSYYKVDIFISYKRTAEEIKSVIYVSGLNEFQGYLEQGFAERRTRMTLRLYSSMIDDIAVYELLHEMYLSTPAACAVEPEVTVSSYPNSGQSRIYDIALDYGVTDTELVAMNTELTQTIETISAELLGSDRISEAYAAATYLSALCKAPSAQCRFPGTLYGAMLEQCDDAAGQALAYKALCDKMDIECVVVEGSVGSVASSAAHSWNIITIDGNSYHVDVSELLSSGASKAFMLGDEQLWGTYFWDTEAYPVCESSYNYPGSENSEETVTLPEETTAPTAQPEETPQTPSET